MNQVVEALAWDGANLYAGGGFTSAGGVSANYIAKWDGHTWSTLNTGMNYWVTALIWDGSYLYASGIFTSAGGVAANRIARWDGSAWSALGSGMNSSIFELIWDGVNLYAGGIFSTAGDKAAGYIAGVRVLSTTPDPLAFSDVTDVDLSSIVTSEMLSISGITTSVDITITNGEYSLNSTPFTSTPGTASNNDTLQLRTTSSASYNTTTDVVVNVGDGGDTWSITTLTDTVPDAFSFTDQTDAALNTLTTSNTITITGLGASSAISITGGEYSINSGAYTSLSGFVNNGDSVVVRNTSPASWSTPVDAILTIGGISDTFTVTTEADTDGDGIGNTLDTNDDNDGYLDTADNCILVANDQLDTDGDNYGNACDSDFNNDDIVNSLDVGLFKTDFFKTGSQETDLNGDSIVNSLDLGLFKKHIASAPGPSGLVP